MMRFAQHCAQHLKRRYGQDGAVERLQERIENGPARDRIVYFDILAALQSQRIDDRLH